MLTPKARPEIYPLSGLRALAALWVLLFHLSAKLESAFPHARFLFDPVVLQGYLGVDVFFILSGFIIAYNYADRFAFFKIPTYAEFLWMRLARLWPVHFVVLAAYAILILGASHWGISQKHSGLYSGAKFLQNLMLTQAWSIPIHESWNVPAWSISCEWIAYLVFPALIFSGIVYRTVRVSTAAGAGALLIMALILQSVQADGSNQYGLVRIAGEFVAGGCLCRLFNARVGFDWNWNLLIPAALAIQFLLLGFLLPLFSLVAYWSVPCLAVIILGLAYHRCVCSRLISTRPFLFGGYISYSLYMVHTLCFITLHNLFPKLEARPMSFLIDLPFAVAVAAGVFYFVEEPCRRKMRGLFPRHKPKLHSPV
jgi:peptidoglycan/LPS O-acetylase OafA/YrhL